VRPLDRVPSIDNTSSSVALARSSAKGLGIGNDADGDSLFATPMKRNPTRHGLRSRIDGIATGLRYDAEN
jgi:hypothetical protein